MLPALPWFDHPGERGEGGKRRALSSLLRSAKAGRISGALRAKARKSFFRRPTTNGEQIYAVRWGAGKIGTVREAACMLRACKRHSYSGQFMACR